MKNSHLADVNKFHGLKVKQYCKNENILPIKLKCGALVLNNFTDLVVCGEIRKQVQTEAEWSQQKKKLNAAKRVKKRKKNGEFGSRNEEKCSGNNLLNKLLAKVTLHETSAKLSAGYPSKRCILDTAISGTQIYKHIMKTQVKYFEITDNNDISSTKELISVLELFRKKHRLHNYKGILNGIVGKGSLNIYYKVSRSKIRRPWECLNNYETTVKQLSIFFTQTLIEVVPIKLFGSLQNREIFTKLVCCILRSTRFQPIYLKPYIEKLNIKTMVWLQSFKKESTQWFMTIKLVKWLLLQYIFKILYKYFHVTVHPSAVGKRLFIQHYLWKRVKNHFIDKYINSNIFLPVDDSTDYWYPPTCEYKLYMKTNGIRPLVQVNRFKEEILEMELSLRFLQQLCVTHYGLSSMTEFRAKWNTIVHTRFTAKFNQIWLVLCDLNDAYGSILLDQLIKIIKMLSKHLPERLNLRWVACLQYRYKSTDITYSKHFSDLELALPIGALCTSVPGINEECGCYASKTYLLKYIRMCILRQNIRVGGIKYLVTKGILQGTILSNTLFDIYYNYVSTRRLSMFLKSSTLFRYVDDLLYVAESMESAIEFIKLIRNGFGKYNCKFRSTKIQTNFYYEDNQVRNTISFLGWRINCNSLEVLPDYPEIHPSYSFTLHLNNYKRLDSISLLKDTLYNYAYLKLSDIIFTDSTNFIKNLKSLIKKISLIHAWRVLMFIQKLFTDLHKYKRDIFQVIQMSNKKLARALLNLYTKDIQKDLKIDREEMGFQILQSLWTTIKRVFFTDITFRDVFKHKLMQEIY